MQIQWRRRDSAIASRCADVEFSLTGEYDAECIEGMENFKYLGRILYRSDDNWTEVLWNVGKARRVWSQMGKLLRR